MKRKVFLNLILLFVLFITLTFAERTHLNSDIIKGLKKLEIKDSFRFAVLGDNRNGDEVFKRLLKQIDELDPKPLFIIDTGDLVPKGLKEEYENFLNIMEMSKIPILTVPGNHDYSNKGLKIYREIFGDANYYFDLGKCRFIILDNAFGVLSEQQLDWLEKLLGVDLKRFVFLHMPPAYGDWKVHCFKMSSDRFMEIIERHKPDIVFAGHIHGYDKEIVDGVTYIVTGGAGAPLYNYPGIQPFYHFVLVEVSKDKIVDSVIKLKKGDEEDAKSFLE